MNTECRDTMYRVAPGVSHRVVGEEVFVLMASGRVHWLKRPSARALWEALAANGATLGELSELLVASFEVSAAVALADATVFVEVLVREGVLLHT